VEPYWTGARNTRSALNADGMERDLHGSVKGEGGAYETVRGLIIVLYKYLMFHFNVNGNYIKQSFSGPQQISRNYSKKDLRKSETSLPEFLLRNFI
jgi:hypothetical protein